MSVSCFRLFVVLAIVLSGTVAVDAAVIFTEDLTGSPGAFTTNTLAYNGGLGVLRGHNDTTGEFANAPGALDGTNVGDAAPNSGVTGEGVIVASFDARPRGDSPGFMSLIDMNGDILFSFGNVVAPNLGTEEEPEFDAIVELTRGNSFDVVQTLDGNAIGSVLPEGSNYLDFRVVLDSLNNTVEFQAADADLNVDPPLGSFVSAGQITIPDFSFAGLKDVRIDISGPGAAGDVIDKPTVGFVPEPTSISLVLLALVGLASMGRTRS